MNIQECIITSTYKGDFKYIKIYLESFSMYLEDKDFPIFFIISNEEQETFKLIIKEYENILNINVILLEDILKQYNIKETPAELYKKYGQVYFQTIKKLYGALYINVNKFLFLDSESMLIKKTNIHQVFVDYFQEPNFFVSKVENRPIGYKNTFVYHYLEVVNNLLGSKPDYWSIESNQWFYELKILKDLINDYGMPIDIINRHTLGLKWNGLDGILEVLLYYQYIINNNNKYEYKIYNVEDKLIEELGEYEFNKFIKRFFTSNCSIKGILEQCSQFINMDNVDGFLKFFKKYKISIQKIRVFDKNYIYLRKIIDSTNIKILASSQEHPFVFQLKYPKKMDKCIVTPTFKGHKLFLYKYLYSYNFYVKKNKLPIILVISIDDYKEIKPITDEFNGFTKIILLEDVLAGNNIYLDSDFIINKYGKFSFQTIKKLCTMLYLNCNKYLVLDTESMFIRNVNINKIFDEYFQNPFIISSEIVARNIDNFTKNEIDNISSIYNKYTNLWFLETFDWFYEKRILIDLFNYYGSLWKMINYIYYKYPERRNEGIFEVLLYYMFIAINNRKYNYNIINIDELLKQNIGEMQYKRLLNKHYKLGKGGFGIVERIAELVNKETVKKIADIFIINNVKFIRIDGFFKNYFNKKLFIELVNPCVLAASQDHFFGINNKDVYLRYIKKAIRFCLKKVYIYIKKLLWYIIPSYRVSLDIRGKLCYLIDVLVKKEYINEHTLLVGDKEAYINKIRLFINDYYFDEKVIKIFIVNDYNNKYNKLIKRENDNISIVNTLEEAKLIIVFDKNISIINLKKLNTDIIYLKENRKNDKYYKICFERGLMNENIDNTNS